MIVVMAGLPGSGKSTIARALALRLGGAVLSKDEIRHALFAEPDVEYSTAQDDFVMEIMLQAAAYLLHKDAKRIVFLDGRTFSSRSQVERVIQAAETLGQPWRILECTCSDKTARERLEAQKMSGNHVAANRDFALYLEVKQRFETISPPKTILDTDLPLEECLQVAGHALS